MLIHREAFSGAEAWRRLTSEQRDRVGELALEFAAANGIAMRAFDCDTYPPPQRAAEHADELLHRAIDDEVLPLIEEELRDSITGAWHLPSILGEVCRSCGCSHTDPCPEGCGWAAPGLCTACADEGETT